MYAVRRLKLDCQKVFGTRMCLLVRHTNRASEMEGKMVEEVEWLTVPLKNESITDLFLTISS